MRVKSLLCVFFLLLMAGGVFAQVQTGSAYPKREFQCSMDTVSKRTVPWNADRKTKAESDRAVEFLAEGGNQRHNFPGTSRSGCSVCFQTGTVESFPYRSAG